MDSESYEGNHVALLNMKPKRIPCTLCGRDFKAATHLSMHMQAKHSIKTATPQLKSPKSLVTLSLECIQIMTGSTFSKKQPKLTDEVINSQNGQTLIQTVRIIPCTYCNRCFKSYVCLSMHVQAKHIPKSLFKLSLQCIRTMVKKQTGTEVAHPQDEQILINTSRSVKRVNVERKSRRRKHKCKHCLLYFTYIQDLNNHITEEHNKPTQQEMPQPLMIKQEPIQIKEEPCDSYIQQTPNKRPYTNTLINNQNVFEGQYEEIKKRKMQELSLKINNVFSDVLEAERKEFTIRCIFCMHYFCDFMDLYNHQDYVHGGCRQCRICWKTFSTKKLVFQHLFEKHHIRKRVLVRMKQEPHVYEEPYIEPKMIKKEESKNDIKMEIPMDLNIKSEPTEHTIKIKEEPSFYYY